MAAVPDRTRCKTGNHQNHWGGSHTESVRVPYRAAFTPNRGRVLLRQSRLLELFPGEKDVIAFIPLVMDMFPGLSLCSEFVNIEYSPVSKDTFVDMKSYR
jgi:hypothetical protein